MAIVADKTSVEILNIVTRRNRRTIIIDEKRVEMLDGDELALAERASLLSIGDRLSKLKDLNAGEMDELSRDITAMIRMLLPNSKEDVLARLTDDQKCQIISVFCQAPTQPGFEGESMARQGS